MIETASDSQGMDLKVFEPLTIIGFFFVLISLRTISSAPFHSRQVTSVNYQGFWGQ